MGESGDVLSRLMEFMAEQQAKAEAREDKLTSLLEQRLDPDRITQGPQLLQTPSVHRAHPINCSNRPLLQSGASLSEFRSWKEAWEDFSHCQQLPGQGKDTVVAALRQCLDEDLKRYIRQGVIEVRDDADANGIIACLERYIRQQRNPLLDRMEFYSLKQDNGEYFNEFFTTLKELYHACAFENHEPCNECSATLRSCSECKHLVELRQQERLRDRVVFGVACDETRHRLLAESDLTLEKAVCICRSEEAAKTTQRDMMSGPSMGKLNAIRTSSYKKQRQSNHQRSAESVTNAACSQCGYVQHRGTTCPAVGKLCSRCGKIGHFARVCPESSLAQSPAGRFSKIGTLKLHRMAASEQDMVVIDVEPLEVGRRCTMKWLPDTGSDVDAMSATGLSHLGMSIGDLEHDDSVVTNANGTRIESLGKIRVMMKNQGYECQTAVHVYEDLIGPLMSKATLKALQYLPSTWPAITPLAEDKTNTGVVCNLKKNHSTHISVNDLKNELMEEFSDVFSSASLPAMDGPPMEIPLKQNATPFKVNTPRTIPYAYRQPVKDQIDKMLADGIIEPVTEPCDWCHPIVVVPKKTVGEVRMTVDLTKLNKQVHRPIHPGRSVKDTISNIESASYFTTLDARHGYWQVPLAESAKALTTFITPWGRYRYLRCPQGFVSSGDEYNRRMDSAFENIQNFGKVVDDCILYDSDYDQHLQHVRVVLTRARQYGITFSASKFMFAQPEVPYCGYIVSKSGWRIDPEKVKAIREFPTPISRTDMRSFMGLVNQFSEFTPRIAELAQPLRGLLKESNEFVWQAEHMNAFDAIRQEVTQCPTLTFFSYGAPTRLETDASRTKGLGFALFQHQGNGWHLIQCGSRFISETESRYAMIELECLAVVWAMQKCHVFLAGSPFTLIIDHKPLVPILNKYSLQQIPNTRLLRLMMKIQSYQFIAEWRKGKDHFVADALSRSPVDQPDDISEEAHMSASMLMATLSLHSADTDPPIPDLKAIQLRQEADRDSEYQSLLKVIIEGFPNDKNILPVYLHPYWHIRDQLTTENGIVLKGAQIVIPKGLRRQVLSDLHSSHQGRDRTQSRARQIVYWPYISNDIKNMIERCDKCMTHRSSQIKEPLLAEPIPDLPFQNTSADIFSCQGCHYLVYSDRLSGWPCIHDLGRSMVSASVIKPLRRWFAELGVPRKIVTDGGPQFSSKRFKDFCKRWQVEHVQSSPHYHQANGHAEAAVKAVKHLIYKTTSNGDLDVDSFQRGLLEWRNTPRTSGQSPAQAVFGRPLASFLFASHRAFSPEYQITAEKIDSATDKFKEALTARYNKSARPLPALRIGQHVCIQDPATKLWSRVGVIVAIGQRRDYYVKLPSGRVYWRNRRFLRPYHPTVSTPTHGIAQSNSETTENSASGPSNIERNLTTEPPRRSDRRRVPYHPFNITSTRGQSYDRVVSQS